MNIRKMAVPTIIAVMLYSGTYAVLSVAGGYVLTQSGMIRMRMGTSLGLSLDDEFVWMPRYGWAQKYQWPDGRNNVRVNGVAGYVYLPAILVDQALVHRTRRFITEDGHDVKGFVLPPKDTLHPMMNQRGQQAHGADGGNAGF